MKTKKAKSKKSPLSTKARSKTLEDVPLTVEERCELIDATREAATGLARVWDALRAIENAHSVILEYPDHDFVASLAIDVIPSLAPLHDDYVWDTLVHGLVLEAQEKTQ